MYRWAFGSKRPNIPRSSLSTINHVNFMVREVDTVSGDQCKDDVETHVPGRTAAREMRTSTTPDIQNRCPPWKMGKNLPEPDSYEPEGTETGQ